MIGSEGHNRRNGHRHHVNRITERIKHLEDRALFATIRMIDKINQRGHIALIELGLGYVSRQCDLLIKL